VLLAVRWRDISAACGANLPFTSALQISFIATFFNQVLPSTVGGDGARIWLLARKGAGWARATYSVLIDRIAGLFVLALIVMACLPFTFFLIHDPIARAVLLVIGVGMITGTMIFVLIGRHFRQLFDRWRLMRHLAAASRISAALCSSHRDAAIVLACSLAIHLITAATAWCCTKAIASPVSFAQILFLMPPVLLIATLPVSIAGWGVRESSFMYALPTPVLPKATGSPSRSSLERRVSLSAWLAGSYGSPTVYNCDRSKKCVPPKSMAKTYDDERFYLRRRVAQPGTLQPLTSELSWGRNKRCVAVRTELI
jgi:uncharacterized protein (TIRG00374 family)